MAESTEVVKGFKKLNPGALDEWWGPYASVALANAAIPNVDVAGVNFRMGKVVGIIFPDEIQDYTWGLDFTDGGLQKKTNLPNLSSLALVTPTITPSWTFFKADGVTPYSPASSAAKNPTTEKGVVAKLTATYKFPVPTAGQALPSTVTGSFGPVIPAANVNSVPLVDTNIRIDTGYSVLLAKPKSGLIVVNNQVQEPVGDDTTGDSLLLIFRTKAYIGFSPLSVLTGAQILILGNAVLVATRARRVAGLTAPITDYTYIVYDESFGPLANVIQDDAAPALGSFTRLADVIVLTDSGINELKAVYKSNSKGAFINSSLTTS